MVKSLLVAFLIVVFFVDPVFSGEVIVALETESYLFSNPTEKIEREKGAFENTYFYDGNTITRTKVSNSNRGQTLSDDTKYFVDKKLINLSASGDAYTRAVGYPGTDAIEVLTFNSKYMQNVKLTGDYIIVTRYRIIKRFHK